MTAAVDPLEQAKENFSLGRYQECLRLLTFAFTENPDNRDCYVLAAMCLRQMNAESEAKLFDQVLASFDDSEVFFKLGYHFMDVGHDRLAIPILKRAFALDPGNNNIGLELAIACCGQFQPESARRILSECDLASNFWLAYQYYWSSMLCGITDGVEQFSKESRRQFLSQAASHEIRGALYALDKMDEFRIRLAALGKPEQHVMYWHFLQYGSAILDYFDNREGQNGLEVAGGRFVYVGISFAQLTITLNKLRHFLTELGKNVKRVISLPDRDSSIIASGAAKILDLPLQIVDDPQRASIEETLLVAANSWDLEKTPIERVLKGQTVFAFNHNWLKAGTSTADVIGLMSQYCTWPWSKERLVIDPKTKQRMEAEEDTRSVEEIAFEFGNQLNDFEPEFAGQLEFYKRNAVYLKGSRLGGNKRWRFITDSPVPGNYFC